MIVKQIITVGSFNQKPIKKEEFNEFNILRISEFFYNSIQGENFIGVPSAFLRLQGCTLECSYCDTFDVWSNGSQYTLNQLFDLMDSTNIINQLKNGQHLVLTGGSPLKQQKALLHFLITFEKRYGFSPYVEVENECTLFPLPEFASVVDCWNNSPKLSGSGNPRTLRHKPEVIKSMSLLENSWFKFVVHKHIQWIEIDEEYIKPQLLKKEQIVLMPLGATRSELEETREIAIEMAIINNVRFCDRQHVIIWDKKTGV